MFIQELGQNLKNSNFNELFPMYVEQNAEKYSPSVAL